MSANSRFQLSVNAAVLLMVAAVLAVATLLVTASRQKALADASQRNQRFVAGAEAAINRNLLGLDMMLAGLPELLADALGGSDRLDHARAQGLLRGLQRRDMLVHDVALLSDTGAVIAAADPNALRLGVRLPAGFMESLMKQSAPTLAVSAPQTNFMTAERTVYFGRKVMLNSVAHAAVAEVPVQMLAGIIAQGMGTDGTVVTLEREDGQLLAAMPANERAFAQRLNVLKEERLNGLVFEEPARLGGAISLLAARPTLYRHIRVTAGIAHQEALLAWGTERNHVLSVAAVFVSIIVALGLYTRRNTAAMNRARNELQRSKGTLDQALEAMSDGFLLCDAHGRVVAWNVRYRELFPWLQDVLAPGVPFERLIEAAALHVMPHATPAELAQWKQNRLELRRSDCVHEQTLANGMVIHSVERPTPDGGVVSVYRDVTAAERKLSSALSAAESANEAKSRFLAAMSHEIRTPLNAVLGLNGLMLNTRLDSEQQRYAELIQSSGKSLLSIINDILDLSKVEAGCMELKLAPFSPWAGVQEVAAMLGAKARMRGIDLQAHCEPDAQAEPPPVLQGDAERFRQVLVNLVGNALKFTERGRIDIHLQHTVVDAERVALRVEVRDTGIGVPASALPTLFERFTQADNSASRKYGGSGLGLAISREMVELMGGTIGVVSQEGVGSTFSFEFALQRARQALPSNDDGHVLQECAELPRLHILVAEDNAVNQILIQAMLAKMGHDCEIVSDGEQAVHKVQEERFDLVLMDVQMPVMDGQQATRAIRALPGVLSQIPIIAVTANAMLADRNSYMSAGMDDYVSKPIDPQALTRAIHVALSRQWSEAA